MKKSKVAPHNPERPADTCRHAENIIDSSADIIIAVDNERRIIVFNKSAQQAFGYEAEEALGMDAGLLYQDPAAGLKVNETLRRSGKFTGEIINRRKNGRTFRTFLSSSVLRDEEGKAAGFVGISRDITAMKKSEESIQRSERFLSTIFDSIKDPFSIIDRDFRIVRVNEAYAHMRNRKASALAGSRCFEALQGRTCVCEDCIVKTTFDSADPCAKDKLLVLPDGAEIWVEIYTYPILNGEGDVTHVIEYTRDITGRKKFEEERKQLIERLQYLSNTDVLTGLLNRRALMDRLNYEADRANRYSADLSLILCDIDYFKEINDNYGHAGGDRVLQAVSEILKNSLRKTDIVGRYGGDEFMLILPETSLKGAEEFGERIRAAVHETAIEVAGETSVKLSLSLGVTSFGVDTKDMNINALIKCADTALYASKKTGKNKVCVVKT